MILNEKCVCVTTVNINFDIDYDKRYVKINHSMYSLMKSYGRVSDFKIELQVPNVVTSLVGDVLTPSLGTLSGTFYVVCIFEEANDHNVRNISCSDNLLFEVSLTQWLPIVWTSS